MNKYTYDLHVHTCLSPCGDAGMTPGTLVQMAMLAECDILAVTDHNSCKNAPAVMQAAQGTGILVIPGMELCVSEEAHIVCLFETMEGAMEFDRYVYARMPHVKNKPGIFGEQQIYDAQDNFIGTEEHLLLIASEISANEIVSVAASFGGVAFPAHVDRDSYSLLTALGAIPPEANFHTVEFSSGCNEEEFLALHPELRDMRILRDSDSHYLEALAGFKESIMLPEKTAAAVLAAIRDGI